MGSTRGDTARIDRATLALPSEEETEILAEAFEISQTDLLFDASWVPAWFGSTDDLLVALTWLHGWDASVAPFYLVALRGALLCRGAAQDAPPRRVVLRRRPLV